MNLVPFLSLLFIFWVRISAAAEPDLNQYPLAIFFDSRNIDSVAEKGFLNQHQTRSSNGHYGPERRAALEDRMSGINLGNSDTDFFQRPKYGLLLDSDRPDSGLPFGHYGDVVAVFKDGVKQFSTWTHADSLFLEDTFDYELFPKPFDIAYRREFYPEEGSYGSELSKTLEDDRLEYIETQTWRDIDLRDVDYFIITKDIPNDKIEELKKLNITIYQLPVSFVEKEEDYDVVKMAELDEKVLIYQGESRSFSSRERRLPELSRNAIEELSSDTLEEWVESSLQSYRATFGSKKPPHPFTHPEVSTIDGGIETIIEQFERDRNRQSITSDFSHLIANRRFSQHERAAEVVRKILFLADGSFEFYEMAQDLFTHQFWVINQPDLLKDVLKMAAKRYPSEYRLGGLLTFAFSKYMFKKKVELLLQVDGMKEVIVEINESIEGLDISDILNRFPEESAQSCHKLADSIVILSP